MIIFKKFSDIKLQDWVIIIEQWGKYWYNGK